MKNTKLQQNSKSLEKQIGKITTEKRLSDNQRIQISGINIDVLTSAETINLTKQYIDTKTPLHLMGVNADKINSTQKNPLLKTIVNNCGVINADGASVVLAGKFLKKPLPERIAGIDLMLSLLTECEQQGYGVYLLGAKSSTIKQAEKEITHLHPKLHIAGVHDGYFQESQWSDISTLIKESKPDIVFVGITSPKKEYLIEYLQNQGHKAVFMGVGGSFDVIAKEIKRAPKWMQSANLEWLFRVFQEPKRLFKRYFVGNIIFIKNILKEKVTNHNERVQ